MLAEERLARPPAEQHGPEGTEQARRRQLRRRGASRKVDEAVVRASA
jgi:hypothetical protein